jgi:CRP-like cAMP-binding protein
MLDVEKIKLYLSLFKDLKLTDLVKLFQMAKTRRVSSGDIYIKEGATYNKLAYIKKGLIRAYTLKENGDEITVLLRWEDQFLASHDNVILHQPSRFIYQALEDTELLEVDYDLAQSVFDQNQQYAKARNFFLLNMLAESMARVETFIMLNPEERYLKLMKEKPDIINRVPSKYIASLLGITPVSLSRIRKRIASHPKH